jgi:diguanylate cyclase
MDALQQAPVAGRSTVLGRPPGWCTAALLTGVEQGLLTGDFIAYYQPVADARSGALTTLEALVRWRHPEHGMIGPADCVPALEHAGAIDGVGRAVLSQACVSAAAWPLPPGGGRPVAVRVNVSARQLDDDTFAGQVASCLDSSGLDPARLVLEITESAPLRDPVVAHRACRAVRDLGVRVSLDDFGTGH